MATFLNTRKAVAAIEELMKDAEEKLILISPYLKLSKDFKELLKYRNDKDKVTTIIFREQALKIDELSFLEELRLVKLLSNESLHAKCYTNDDKMIITSLNLYEFSMANNKEMGVLIEKGIDQELYEDSFKEVEFIKDTSIPFKYSTKLELIPKATIIEKKEMVVDKVEQKVDFNSSFSSKTKYKSTSALSKIIGIQSKELFEILGGKGWIKKDGKSWILTQEGKQHGGQMKNGQYGEYVAWPEEIVEEI